MELLDLLRQRYSVRNFSDRRVEDEKLEKIIEAGRIAPTAKNSQPQRIYVLKSEEAIAKIRSVTRCAYNAPVVIMVAIDRSAEWENDLEPGVFSGKQDAAIVATQMMLEAADQGLGSCYVCWFSNKLAHDTFNLPENEEVEMILDIGYPAEGSHPAPNHTSKLPREATVREL